MKTGLLIKTAREKAGVSQAQLASKMGVTNHCISSWERGKRKPKYETLSRIADALGVDVNCLILGNDVVAAVRCKDCIHRLQGGYCKTVTDARVTKSVNDNFFCGYGERRGEDVPDK
jgi:transcriptional regulator with XRE-family HTH domain